MRKAVARMGFNVVRSVSAAFAMRQLKKREELADIQVQIEQIWHESIEVAALCFVLARAGRVNSDEAMLTGLLHVLGKLYIVMRAKELGFDGQSDLMTIINDWHGVITKAILESWGLPGTMRDAVEEQEHLDYDNDEGPANQTHVLIAAKLLRQGQEAAPTAPCPALIHFSVDPANFEEFMTRRGEEVANVKATLGGA